MKPRNYRTFEDAITTIMGELSPEGAAAAVGKSTQLIRRWSDPDDDTWPNVRQALQLSIAYRNEGHFSDPITECYTRSVEALALRPTGVSLQDALLTAQTALGHLSAVWIEAKSPCGPDGEHVNNKEKQLLRRGIDNIRKILDEMEAGLDANTSNISHMKEAVA